MSINDLLEEYHNNEYEYLIKPENIDILCEEIERLKNTLKDIEEYINFLVIFNQPINGKFSETIWGQEILDFIKGSDEE